MNRIVGLETEYGCLSNDPAGPQAAVARTRSWAFENERFGLPDVHQRDWDEPAGNGGFLFNGGRLYVDMGHIEYCTPECFTLRDLVRYDRAGDELLVQALQGTRLAGGTSFIRNNIDHYSGATFGCHENYLVRRSAPLHESNVLALLTFLTLRVLYTGAGRVGSSAGAENRGDTQKPGANPYFQISQRADYINNELFEWVQFNRSIINTRDEPLADPRRYRRLHLLHGDTSVLPSTLALKAGTTSLVLDLLEIDKLPQLYLADTVATFRQLSHQPDGPWLAQMVDGRVTGAIDLLRQYCETAETEFRGRDPETDLLLRMWNDTLTKLDDRPDALVGRVDWITKRWLFRQFIESEGLDWNSAWLRSQDLEFHNIDAERSLGLALIGDETDWCSDASAILQAQTEPPRDTRACARSMAMRALQGKGLRYYVDWEVLDVEGVRTIMLNNPFESSPPELAPWCEQFQPTA